MAKSSTKKSSEKKLSSTPLVASVNESSFAPLLDTSLEDLFFGSLRKMYWGECHLVGAIPKMIAAASSSTLKRALEDHLEITNEHVERLEKVFEIINRNVTPQKCDVMEGLTMSGEQVIDSTLAHSEVRDTGIIMSALKVENFEMISYNGLIQLGTKLSLDSAVDIFRANLEEESEASDTLQSLS